MRKWEVSEKKALRVLRVAIMTNGKICAWQHGKFCPHLQSLNLGNDAYCSLFAARIDARTLKRAPECIAADVHETSIEGKIVV